MHPCTSECIASPVRCAQQDHLVSYEQIISRRLALYQRRGRGHQRHGQQYSWQELVGRPHGAGGRTFGVGPSAGYTWVVLGALPVSEYGGGC